MGYAKFSTIVVFTFAMLSSFGQSIVVDGTTLTNVPGGPVNNCAPNGYRMVGASVGAGNCVSLTQTTFSSGALWVCDEINLNQSFKVSFQANLGAINSGDGIAFVLKSDANIDLVGGAGGGMGYTFGTNTGCFPPTNCSITPSVVVEFDTWNNSVDPWSSNTPALGTIDDIACDHATILTNANQTAAGTIAGPNCLLPMGANVTDGLPHDVCIIWDVPNLQYSVYFDSALVTTYNGDIRAFFVNPPVVRWGFTAGSGGANQNQSVCDVEMVTSPVNPSCNCTEPVASFLPDPVEICSGELTGITLSSTVPGTTYEWNATDNTNVNGESLALQNGASIDEALTNSSTSAQVVNYTVTPMVACTTGADLIIPVTVYPIPTLLGNSTVCIGSTTQLTGSGTVHPFLPWMSSNPAVATVTNTGLITGISVGTTDITYMDINDCQTTITLTVSALDDASFTTTDFCEGTVSPAPVVATPGGTFFYNPNPVDGSTVDLNTGSITNGVGGSTYTIAYTTIGACPATSTQTVSVNAAPTINVPNYTVCNSGTITLTATGATTYSWSPATNLSASTGASVDFTAGTTTTYDVSGTDANGCVGVGQTTVTVAPNPTIDAGVDQTLCEGDFLTLSGNGGVLYVWDNGVTDGLPFNPPVGTTTYTVTGSDANGCTSTDQVDINVNPSPTVAINGTSQYCAGTFATLSASGVFTSYLWSTGAVTPTINATIADNPITLTVTDNLGCSATSTVFLLTETTPFTSNSTVEICDGQSAVIHGNTETIAGVYTQTLTLPSGCDSTSNITLIVNPLPAVSAGADLTVCEGEQVTLSGSGALIYAWNPATVIDGQAFSPSTTAIYTVTGTDANGCVNTDDVTVTIEPAPSVSFVADFTVGCAPLDVTLTNTTQGSFSDCIWTLSNGTVLTGCGSVSTVFTDAGFYDVTLQIASTNGCFSTETYTDYIYVEDVTAAFTPSPSVISGLSDQVNFLNNSSGAVSYFWDFGDNGATSTLENPSHVYNEAQPNVEVELIAYSPLGCSDTAQRILLVNEEPIFYVPNTFTPDGDEMNQYFQPVFTSGYDANDFEILIFNRWGEIIWESNDDTVGWDGSDANQSTGIAQDGTYVWKITFQALSTDERIEVVGHVNLIR
ncbi:MAG: gliding motility-associated C-terminal domain-containing protein [Crocinitomicaceae bacterium]|nr:gliding motility-associated C-terminal domain-containing protein [Crocinitomicaceae bacterium]